MRRAATALAAVLLLGALAGCGILTDPYRNQPSDGGWSSVEAIADLESIPGVASAGFRLDPWDNPGEGGLFSSSGVNFVLLIDVAAGYRVEDAPAFLDAAMRLAWSINDDYSPQGSVALLLTGGTDVDHDWESDVRDLFGTDLVLIDREGRADGIRISISDDLARARYGAWPAEPQEFGHSLVVAGDVVAVDPAAVGDFYYSGITGGGHDCWNFSFALGVADDGGRYPGDVTVTLLVGGREEKTQVVRGRDREPEDTVDGTGFCYPERRPGNFDNVTFRVETEPVDGFRAVSVEYPQR